MLISTKTGGIYKALRRMEGWKLLHSKMELPESITDRYVARRMYEITDIGMRTLE